MKQYILILISILVTVIVSAQEINGTVFEIDEQGKQTPLVGANVFWQNSQKGTSTDAKGKFKLYITESHEPLIVSYIGFENDTVHIYDIKPLEIALIKSKLLQEVEVKGKSESTIYSTTKTINQVTITEKELQKAACCNLSESFETEGTVDVMYRDGVTGAKEIQMLGLNGSYTQMLHENIPALRGLSTSFGLNYVPGTWIEGIQISKGVGSVVNGYESMAGQINLEYKKPLCKEPRFFLNLYGNHLGRAEANVHLSKRFNDKVGSMLLLHGSNVTPKIDLNNDSFLDVPLTTQVNAYNRWETIFNEKVEMQTGINVLYEDRLGGQRNFSKKESYLNQNAYGVNLNTFRVNGFNKLGYIYNPEKGNSIGFIINGVYHQQNGFFGKKQYDGKQTTLYANIISQTQFKKQAHKIKNGISFMYDSFDETFDIIQLQRTEVVPGIFSEYAYNNKRTSLLIGGRADYHNLYGIQFTPRVHFKHDFTPQTIVRVSGGRGFRVPNLFSENTNVLVSSRNIIFSETIQPEISWNFGGGILQKFIVGDKELTFNVDFYRTQFINQLVVDLDEHLTHALFYNLNGQSYSNSFQFDVNYEILEGWDIKATYKFNDVKTTYSNNLRAKIMVPRHTALFNTGYVTPNEKWLFNTTLHIYGKARLAHNSFTEIGNELNMFSPVFATINAQITKKWNKIEWYVGGENLTNFKQPNPIVDSQNPFGNNFDASMVWGPIVGIVVYSGIRLTIQ
jgi:outer membrane receptor for ferrienterochelin and colicin